MSTICRVFICLTCRRIIAGCLTHPGAVVEPISSCAVCAKEKK